MIAAATYYALMAAPAAPVQIVLTSGTSWTVPDDWNNSGNKVECIGAGASNFFQDGTANFGGGGGAYAMKQNIALTPGATVSYRIGSSSKTLAVNSSWFVSDSTVKAAGATNATGASVSNCVGDLRYAGGNGGASYGGGGAAGPNGNGMGGSVAKGGDGDAGFGGIGSASNSQANGGAGLEWGSAGSGGGGGNTTLSTRAPGAGGAYGGGAGADVQNLHNAGGAKGVIVITYVPG